MREVFIDLSPDDSLKEIKVFGGYSGEHNETLLKIKLPQRLIADDFLYYYFKFETGCGEEILSVPISCAQITDSIVEKDLFDTKLMGVLTPRPSEITARFFQS